MIIPSTVALVLFLFEQVVFVSGAVLMWRIYQKYRFPSHGYMQLSFVLWMLSSLSRILLNATEQAAPVQQANFLWAAMNFFLILGIITTFYSFFYFQYNRLPARSNIASIMGGATLLAFSNPDWFHISYLADVEIYIASYDSVVSLIAGPLILLFIIVFLLPILTKVRLAKTRKVQYESLSLLIVPSFLLLWAATNSISSIAIVQTIRPFFFAAGWGVWIVLTTRRPLNLIFTKRKFEKILVMTDSGYPVLLYDLNTEELSDPALFSALFSALQSMMNDLLDSITSLKSIYYANKVVSIERRKHIVFLGIGDEPDTALLIALQVFSDNLLASYQDLVSPDGTVAVDLKNDAEIKEIIGTSFEKVIFR